MSLTGRWKLDGNANDSVGSNHGTIVTPSYKHGRVWSAGVEGGMSVSAAGNILTLPASAAYINGNTFTISLWFKAATVTGTQYLISNLNPPAQGFSLQLINGMLRFTVKNADSFQDYDFLDTTFVANKWYYIKACAQCTGDQVYLSVNGVADSQVGGTGVGYTNPLVPIVVGCDVVGGNRFSGIIDDVKIYNSGIFDGDTAAYNADIASGAAIYTLRSSDGDVSDVSPAFTLINSLFPLTEDVNMYVQGGQVFGSTSSEKSIKLTFNGHTVKITTDPLEQATPATLKISFIEGRYLSSTASLGYFELSKIKVESNFGYDGFLMLPNIAYSLPMLKMSDCLLIWNRSGASRELDLVKYTGAAAVAMADLLIKNNTFVLSGGTGNPITTIKPLSTNGVAPAAIGFHNNIIAAYNAGAISVIGHANLTGKKNVAYNYGGGGISFATGTWTDSEVATNPNFSTGAIVSESESIDTLLAKDWHLTADSTACRDRADAATATYDDIEGKVRA